jgi:putative transposase
MRIEMSIAKFEFSFPELRKAVEAFQKDRVQSFESIVDGVREAVSASLNQVLNSEIEIFLGNPEQKDNKRNGYSERDYALKGIGTLRIKVPIDRKRRFSSAIIPKNERIDPRLKEDLAALSLAGLSTRTLALISNRILGIEVSHMSVANSLGMVSEGAEKWLLRPITGKYWALMIDGTYFNVRRRNSVEKEPSLVVLAIDDQNHKTILAIEPGHRDNVDSWRSVFRSLKERGLDPSAVRIGVMDGLPGLENLFCEEFPQSITARCWVHSLRNSLAKCPARLSEAFKKMAQKIMYAQGEADARQAFVNLKIAMGKDGLRAVSCLEKDLDSLVSHFRFKKSLWHALKTTNSVERINKEFKRRSKSMDSLGEIRLRTLLAFTAMRLEVGWQRRAVDTYDKQLLNRWGTETNQVDKVSHEEVKH